MDRAKSYVLTLLGMIERLTEKRNGQVWTLADVASFRAEVTQAARTAASLDTVGQEAANIAAALALELFRVELLDGFVSLDELEERLRRAREVHHGRV